MGLPAAARDAPGGARGIERQLMAKQARLQAGKLTVADATTPVRAAMACIFGID